MHFINWDLIKRILKKWYIFIILLLIYIPLILIVLLSFNGQTDRENINLNFIDPSVENYLLLFQDSQFINALINTLLLALVVTPSVLIISVLTCFGIWNSTQKQIKSVLLTSNVNIVNPEAITGISLMLLFSATLIPLGVNLGFITVALAHISFCTPYAIIAIYPRMAKMNQNLIYASQDLGYSKTRTFYKVIIPYLSPAIISGATISFAMSFDDFIITNLVNGSFQTIGTAIYSSRRGIKAWIVTFGAIVVIITLAIIVANAMKQTIVHARQRKLNAKRRII